jgi:proteic killer suppression protein
MNDFNKIEDTLCPQLEFVQQTVAQIYLQLARLEAATSHHDMNLPNWRLHPLKGHLQNHWAVWVDKNWRLTFTFDRANAVLVDYQDYH